MTFPRYSRALWADEPAKVAKAAKVQQNQVHAVAEVGRKLAKVEPSPPSFSHAQAKLSPRKSAENVDFSRFSHFSQEPCAQTPATDRPALVQAWEDGFERLLSMAPPERYPAHAWSSLIDDADLFMKRWADQATGLAWESWKVWGVHRHAPWHRIGAMGLVPSLQGRRLIALTADCAVVETSTSNLLRFYRRPSDPLTRADRALIWELG